MKNFLFVLLLFLSSFQLFSQTTTIAIKAEGNQDAIVSSYSPDNNYQNYTISFAHAWTNSGTPFTNRSFMGFDLSGIPSGTHIVEAKLSLYYGVSVSGEHSTTSGSNASLLMRINQPWDASTLTWNNQPTATSTNQVILPKSIDPNQDYLNIDVTNLIKDMIQEGNYGFLLKLVTEQYYRRLTFASANHAETSKHPMLVIKYSTIAGTAPTAANGLVGAESSPLAISLSWTDNATTEANYIVEKSIGDNTNYSEIATLAANTNTTIITDGIVNKSKYFFRIKAVDSNGYYSYSNEVSVLTGSISMDQGNKTVCNMYHFDAGVNNPYASLENYTQTLTPADPTKRLKFTLNTLSLTSGDILTIYDGNSTSSPKIVEITGSTIPTDIITASNSDGKLTLKFVSDDDILKNAGWEAYITCVDPAFPPTNLILVQNTADTIEFSWTDTISTETGFEIQRSTNNVNFSTIATTIPNTTSYIDDENIFSGSNYYYRARTITAVNKSTWSDTLSVLTPGPAAPSSLNVSSPSNTSVLATWIDNSTSETGFLIERSITSTSGFSKIAEVPANTTSFLDETPAFNTIFYYRVSAVAGTDSSNYSAVKGLLVGSVTMNNAAETRCNYYLLDPGGIDYYSDNLTKTMVLNPVSSSDKVKLVFESFSLENNYDKLYIYDGLTISSPLIATLTGSSLPDSINATNVSGSLTLKMTTDYSGTSSGFKTLVSCIQIPIAPSGMVIIDSTTKTVTFGWSDNSDNEVQFNIYRSTSATGTYNLVGNVGLNIVQYTDSNLNPATTYYYKVRALGTDGLSGFSNYLEVTTGGPAVPSALTAISEDNNSIILNWIDNSTNETNFIIERSLSQDAGFVNIAVINADSTNYIDQGLAFNTIYYYRMFAISDNDSSIYTSTVKCLTGAVIMNNISITRCDYYVLDPGGLSNYPNSSNKITVLNSTEYGAKVKLDFESFYLQSTGDYLYVYDGTSTSDPLLKTLGGSTVPSSITATNPAGSLTLKFVSSSSTNYSGFKIHVSCLFTIEPPSELTLLTATTKSISFYWKDNSTHDNGAYVYRSLTENGNYICLDTLAENINIFTDNNLKSGTDYYYAVRAKGVDGVSILSDTLLATTTGPKVPSNFRAYATGNSTVKLSWTDNSSNETGFVIERSVDVTSGFAEIITVNAESTDYTDQTVDFNTPYYYRMRSIVGTDSSEYTQIDSIVAGHVILDNGYIASCDYYLLDPGGNENYGNSLDKTIKLFPMVAGQKVKLNFTSFNVENLFDKLYVYDGSLITDPLIATLTGSSLPDSIMASNSEGALTLRFTSDGSGNRAGFLAHVTCIFIPASPTDLILVEANKNSIQMSWTDNSTLETGFAIYRSNTLNGTYTKINTVDADITVFTDTNLNSGTTYYYKVYSLNGEYHSVYSADLSATTAGPKAPSNLIVNSPDNTSALLTWTDNSINESGFIIERSLISNTGFETIAITAANITEYSDGELLPGSIYYYRLKSFVGTDSSEFTDIKSVLVGSLIINNTEITRCDYYLFDNGGMDNYSDNSIYWVILSQTSSGKTIKLNFEEFDLELNKDYLSIYNGTSTASGLVGSFTGNSIPDSLWAVNSTGKLYLRFTSNATVNATGFKVFVGCVDTIIPPSNLAVAGVKNDSIQLSWDDNSANETGFYIYRSLSSNGTYFAIGSAGIDATSYIDTELNANTTYYYKVKARNNEIYSGYSNTISASTLVSSIVNLELISEFNVFPNPANDYVDITFSSENTGATTIEIYTITGNRVFQNSYIKSDKVFSELLNLKKLSAGSYIVKVIFNENSYSKKLYINQ
ncbi:MAG: hypothetical protein A2W99_15935 [Bacteroidetes bacterium GWF2_33_16]|nr:MAG: hypothetical protein A2X00_15280 [Bacteroidetes bacterium GWE2_32_14]OFY02394.1 MAG: hypothetical protein A2W99_15935 [Bacteroidetes bacterium GWF2_33_16]